MKAVIYTSNTGSAKSYAQMISRELNIPAYCPKEAVKNVPHGSKIIYVGWIMAGKIKGYSGITKKYRVGALCAVGMSKTGLQTSEVRSKNKVSADIPLFTLQGNFSVKSLHGIYKIMMSIMVKTAGKALEKKADKTPEEEDMLNMMLCGENKVSKKNLAELFEFLKNNN